MTATTYVSHEENMPELIALVKELQAEVRDIRRELAVVHGNLSKQAPAVYVLPAPAHNPTYLRYYQPTLWDNTQIIS